MLLPGSGSMFEVAAAALQERAKFIARATVDGTFSAVDDLPGRYAGRGEAYCLEDCLFHIRYLALAVSTQQPVLFTDYLQWARTLLISYKVPPEDLEAQVRVLGDTVAQEIGEEEQVRVILDHLRPGLERLSASIEGVKLAEPTLSRLHPLAADYLDALLAADRRRATDAVVSAVKSGMPIRSVYLDVFQPVQREIGRLWQYNKITVAQEHFCTAVTQHAMSQLYTYLFQGARNGRVVVAASVSGELHELGIRMVSDFFEMDGWDSFYLGANMPAEGIVAMLVEQRADVLALSATITPHVSKVSEIIRRVRQSDLGHIKVLVGGYPFNVAPDLWRQVQADGFARDAEEAVATANALVAGLAHG